MYIVKVIPHLLLEPIHYVLNYYYKNPLILASDDKLTHENTDFLFLTQANHICTQDLWRVRFKKLCGLQLKRYRIHSNIVAHMNFVVHGYLLKQIAPHT